jgi:hypothetical protein
MSDLAGRDMKKKNIGSTFDSWLLEESLYEKVSASAIEQVVARHAEELERINSAVDQLNSEAAQVLEYQTLDK